jgi:nucleotide-binding universal stress UspA family protein
MLPISKIIAPTDFSDASKIGLQTAVELASHFSAELHLVHIVTPIPEFYGAHAPTGYHIPSVLKELQEGARSSLRELVDQELPDGIESDQYVTAGDPATGIVHRSDEIGADIIVMATHGVTGWKRLVTGSVTEKVIRTSEVPVLSVSGRPAE